MPSKVNLSQVSGDVGDQLCLHVDQFLQLELIEAFQNVLLDQGDALACKVLDGELHHGCDLCRYTLDCLCHERHQSVLVFRVRVLEESPAATGHCICVPRGKLPV